ncbi:TPA: hypothetical protein SAN82_002225 [Pseudomonas putida]|nr:hypothetical protein [Pseudomonas putida]
MVPPSTPKQAPITFRLRQNLNTSLDAESQLGMNSTDPNNIIRQSKTIPNAFKEGGDGYCVLVPPSKLFTPGVIFMPTLKVTNLTTGIAQNFPASGTAPNFFGPPGYLWQFEFFVSEGLAMGPGNTEFEAAFFNTATGTFIYSPRCLFQIVAP